MSEKRSFAVGVFVLGGCALGAAAIIVFGGVRLFSPAIHVVSYFPGSIAGLAVGAPVTFRGVKVGIVAGMRVHMRLSDLNALIPVTMDLDPSLVSWAGPDHASGDTNVERAVAAGLRAQLVSQSLVTGQLGVDLDFHPEKKAVLTPGSQMLEIPATTSDLQHLKDQLVELNLQKLSDGAQRALTSLQRVLDELGGKAGPISDSVLQTASDARVTLQSGTLAVRALQEDAARTLRNVDQLALAARTRLAVSGGKLDEALARAALVLAQANRLTTSLDEATASRSPLRTDLASTMRDLAASAASLRLFTRDLQRNPGGTLLGHEAR